jgi:hypothetical protein
MLTFAVTLDEIITHMHYPVASEVVRFMIRELGLTDYMDNNVYINSVFHGQSRSYDKDRRPRLDRQGFMATMRLHTNPANSKWEALTAGQAMDARVVRKDAFHVVPLLQDKPNLITVAERYLPCGIELECRMIFLDKTTAFDAMTRMYSTIGNNNFVVPINLRYNYRIPMTMVRLLWHLAYLTGVKKEGFVDWLIEKSNGKISRLVGKSKRSKAMELVVDKDHFEAYITTEYSSDEPEIQGAGTSADRIIVPFTAYIQFARTNMLCAEYPIVVNNRVVPESMVTTPRDGRFTPFVKLTKYGYKDLDGMLQAAKMLFKNPVRNPWYDTWQVPYDSAYRFYNSIPFFIGVFTLDIPEECTCGQTPCSCIPGYTTVDILDLDKYRLTDTVLDYFRENKRKCLHPKEKYNLMVFVDNTQISRDEIEFDGESFRLSNAFGRQRIYRFVISRTPQVEYETRSPFLVLDCIVEVNKEKP